MSDRLADLVRHLAASLVDEPEAVEVRQMEEGGTTVLELHVAPQDLGKIIGKKGATARAVRTVLFAAAGRARRRAVLNILEET